MKIVELQQKLGKQGFHYDAKKFFEPVSKANKITGEKVHKGSKYTAKTSEEMNG